MAHQVERILDEYLVASAMVGDRARFDLLARRWHKKLVAHAWRLTGDPETAAEAAQAGWLEIERSLHSLHDVRAFPAWAYRIVSRCCARQIGGAVRQRDLAAVYAREPLAAESLLLDEDEVGWVRAAVRGLPPDQRAAVALFHFEELSVAEVAVALNVPVGTVKTRLMHARRKLRSSLEGET